MNARQIICYSLAALLAGCVPVFTLHPIYEDADLIFEPKLLGTWQTTSDANDQNKEMWQFSESPDKENAYKLLFTATNDDGTSHGSFDAHLIKLDGKLILDLFPDRLPSGVKLDGDDDKPLHETPYLYDVFFLLPVHTFIAVDINDAKMTLALTDDDKMKEILKEDPSAVQHDSVNDGGTFILTAHTGELQSFIRKYADDPRLFPDTKDLTKIAAPEPNTPPAAQTEKENK
jgi:hypothetical protein